MFQTQRPDEYPFPDCTDSDTKHWPNIKLIEPLAWFHVSFIDETTQEIAVIMSLSLEKVFEEVDVTKDIDIQVVCPPKAGSYDKWQMLSITEIYQSFDENDPNERIGFLLITEYGRRILLRPRSRQNEISENLVRDELIYKR